MQRDPINNYIYIDPIDLEYLTRHWRPDSEIQLEVQGLNFPRERTWSFICAVDVI